MKKYFLLAMLISLAHTTFAQTNQDSLLPQKWLVYLDSNLKVVTDTSLPVYSRYTYFVKGKEIYPQMKNYIGNNFKLEIHKKDTLVNTKLNGIYSWYDANGKLSSQHTFKNGDYISIKEFDKKGRLRQYFDFTQKSKCDSLSYCVYQYNKKSNRIKTFYIQKDENGNWPKMR